MSSGFIKMKILIKLGLLLSIILVMFLPYSMSITGELRLAPYSQHGIRIPVIGEIESVEIKEGDWVKTGQVIAYMKGRSERKAVEEAEASLEAANAKLKSFMKGPKQEEIKKAEQEVQLTRKTYEYSKLFAERGKNMFAKKAISEKEYNELLRQRDLDFERLVLAGKNLELILSKPKREDVEYLEAQVKIHAVKLEHAKKSLQLTRVVSPVDGVVITPNISQAVGQFYEVGDLFAVIENSKTLIAEIEVSEKNLENVGLGDKVTLKTWAYPTEDFKGDVVSIGPVAYEKSLGRPERSLTNQELLIGQKEILKEQGKVIRVVTLVDNKNGRLKSDMTGYAKIEGDDSFVGLVFTRWLVRFVMVEVWSWIP